MMLTIVVGTMGISFAAFILHILESVANKPGAIETHYQIFLGLVIGAYVLLIVSEVLVGLALTHCIMVIKSIEAIRSE